MLLCLPILVFILSQIFQTAPANRSKFGYHCSKNNSTLELPYKELREVCSTIPKGNDDRYMEDYKFGPITCSVESYGVKGICGENKIFVERQHEKSPCGACVCNDSGPRKLLYHPPTNKCFYIYEKGFCSEGSLIALNHTTQRLGCTRNPCHSNRVNQVEFNGKCVELYTGAEECKDDEFLGFEWDNPEPKCTKQYPEVTGAVVIHESEEKINPTEYTTVEPGEYYTGSGILYENEEFVHSHGQLPGKYSTPTGSSGGIFPPFTQPPRPPLLPPTPRPPGGAGISYPHLKCSPLHILTFSGRCRQKVKFQGGGGIFNFNQDLDQCPPGQQLTLSGRCAGSWIW